VALQIMGKALAARLKADSFDATDARAALRVR